MSVLMPRSCHIQIRSGFLVINVSPVSNVFTISDALCSIDVFCKGISWPLGVENESHESNFASQSSYQMFQLTEVKNAHCPNGKNKNKSPCHLRSLFKERGGFLWAYKAGEFVHTFFSCSWWVCTKKWIFKQLQKRNKSTNGLVKTVSA